MEITPQFHVQLLRQFFRIAAGAPGRTKAGHGHRHNSVPVDPQTVESLGRHQQRQSRIEPAGQADHGFAATGMF